MAIDNIEAFLADKFIRDKLTKIRKSNHLTQKQVSEISGLSTTTISNIESGDNSYTLRSLIRYTEALGYEIDISKKVVDDNDTERTDQGVPAPSP